MSQQTDNGLDATGQPLRIGEMPVEVAIVSDPFVCVGKYFYEPTIRVKSPRTDASFLLSIRHASFKEPLESIRKRNGGTLVGVTVQVWKDGSQGERADFHVEPIGGSNRG